MRNVEDRLYDAAKPLAKLTFTKSEFLADRCAVTLTETLLKRGNVREALESIGLNNFSCVTAWTKDGTLNDYDTAGQFWLKSAIAYTREREYAYT